MKSDNSTRIFTDAKVNCSSDGDKTSAEWSNPYHPIFHPKDKSCEGYVNIRDVVPCAENATVPERFRESQRICNCVDPGVLI